MIRRNRRPKGRKTSQEEKIQITEFCLEHDKDYILTMETYKVSYQQIYSWVKKYLADGPDGLIDRRGRHRSDETSQPQQDNADENDS